jgi:hypothetical protein
VEWILQEAFALFFMVCHRACLHMMEKRQDFCEKLRNGYFSGMIDAKMRKRDGYKKKDLECDVRGRVRQSGANRVIVIFGMLFGVFFRFGNGVDFFKQDTPAEYGGGKNQKCR